VCSALSLFCWLLLVVLLPLHGAAQRTLNIERFHAQIVVLPGGELRVTENITAQFNGAWNGIYRTIPVRYETPQHLNYTLQLVVVSATDEAGTPLKYEQESERGYRKIKIWVPNAVNTTHTVALQYKVANGLRFFDEHDELYWNVTGDAWDVPIGQASAQIVLPTGAQGVRATSFVGASGSRDQSTGITIAGNGVDIEASRPLGFREGLTVVVGWNPLITRPTAAAKAGGLLRSNLIFLLPMLALFGMWRVWQQHGRDPERRAIATAYEPPENLTPAEVGTLIDHSPDLHDITATLVDLAVRGYLVIEERTDKVLGLFSSTGYTFELKKPRAEWSQLRSHERRILEGVFDRGDRAEDDDLKNRFYKDLPGIRNSLFDQLVEAGHYKRRPDSVRGMYVALALVSGAAVAGLGIWLNQRAGIETTAPAVIAGVLTAIAIGAFALAMPARTVRGARALEQVLGFEDFLRRVESDRFERVIKTPELFEKYLPYAMALKVDQNWCRAFKDIYREPPQWYAGGRHDTFSIYALNSSLHRMTAATGAAMTAAPRSSSGSSGFSGGSSGGGFGGGGGGGF
jgi:hypothetical protein